MMTRKRALELLGLDIDNLNYDIVNKRFRELAIKNHPDTQAKKENISIAELKEAREVLFFFIRELRDETYISKV